MWSLNFMDLVNFPESIVPAVRYVVECCAILVPTNYKDQK